MKVNEYKKDEVIFRQGDYATSFTGFSAVTSVSSSATAQKMKSSSQPFTKVIILAKWV